MDYIVLLDRKSNFRDAEAEEQMQFALSIIEALEVPFEWDPSKPFDIADKLRLNKFLSQYSIAIVDDNGGNVKIYLENQLIAEWHKATYIVKEDLGQVDPKKRLYVEMKCSFWSMFEEQDTKTQGNT